VAVGKPEEKLSLLGAARMYFNYDEWRKKVESLIWAMEQQKRTA
jgi:hypothetical protein